MAFRILPYLFCLMILAATVPGLYAQQNSSEINGLVIDEAGENLAGVHVTLINFDIGTVTNRDGQFTFRNITPGNYTIRFSMIGFQTHEEEIEIETGSTVSLEIVLNPTIFQAGELVVTASRRSQLIGKVSVSMSTVSPEELRSRNITSLDQVLETVPGVQVLGNSVNIRGSSGFTFGVGSRVALLVDGVPLMGPDQGGFDFDGLPLTQTRQIEVLKSPGSALYGGGALGGVVNIITKDFPDQPETTLRYYTGGYEPVRFEEWRAAWPEAENYRPMYGLVFGRSEKLTDRFGYWISGTLREDAGYMRENRLRGAEVYTKFGWDFSRDITFSIYSSARRNLNQQFLYWNGLDDVLNPGTIDLGGDTASGSNETISDRLTILPVFKHRVGESLEYTLKGRLFGVAARPLDSRGNIRPRDRHNVGVRYGGEAQVDYFATDNIILTAGATFDENYIRSDFFVGEDSLMVRNQPEGAVFLQAETDWTNRLTTTAGFRYDAYQIHTLETATQFSPKFSASYAFSNQFTGRVSVGRGFRVPSVAERFVSNRDFLPLESNIALEPETSLGYEAGFTLRNRLWDRLNLRTELTGFWNEYSSLVEPTFIASLGAFQFINLTEAQIRGFETSLELSSNDRNHTLNSAYTFLDAIDTELNEPLTYRTKHLLQISGRSQFTSWMEAGFDVRAASAPEKVDTDFSLFVPDADIFPATYVTDIRTRFIWDQPVRGVELSATLLIRNLFDYYYVERPAIFAAPRSYQLVMDITF